MLSKIWTFLCRNYWDDSEGLSYGQLVIGSFITTRYLFMHHISCRVFWWNIKSPRSLSPAIVQICCPACNFLLFPNLNHLWKRRDFRSFEEIQENIMGQLMAIRRTVWGPKMPTLKGTETSLSYAQCFLYLTSSSINVPIFHITCLDTFWTDLV